MVEARGNVTVAALLASGAATFGLALAGMVGLRAEVRADDASRLAPAQQQVRDAIRSDQPGATTPAPATTTAAPKGTF